MSDFVVKPYVKFVPAEQDAVAEVAASAAEANTAAQGANTKIGDLSQLTTTAKTNLVAAINEAAQSSGANVLDLGLTITCTVEDYVVTITGANFAIAPNLEAMMAATAVKYVVDFGNNDISEMRAAITVIEDNGGGVSITTGIYNEDMPYNNLAFEFTDGVLTRLAYYAGSGTLTISHTIGGE